MARIIETGDLDPRDKLPRVDNDWIYNGLDCCVTLEIANTLADQCDDVARATYEFSLALQAPVLEMTLRGIRVDTERLKLVKEETLILMDKIEVNLERLLREGLGLDINWRSPKQLMWLLYDYFGLKPIRKRNANGGFSPTVNRDALEKLASNFYAEPIINHILKLRDLEKRRQFLETKLDRDERMRASWNIAGTNTGRLSSAESDFGTGTNNQNIDRNLREIFIPDPAMKIANIDLEQADARNVGAICWNLFVDKHGPEFAGSFLDACESGDLHTHVCSLGWPELPWTEDRKANRIIADGNAYRDYSYRDLAKRLGHGSNYLGLRSVAQAIKMPIKEITAFQERYFEGFPCIQLWHEAVRYQLKELSYITTLLGRRRFFFGRHNDDNTLRAAIAYEPQSMTADEIDQGMLEVWRTGAVQLLAQVHDSILFQYPEELEDSIIPAMTKLLERPLILKGGREFIVPAEAKVGWNWGDKGHDGSNPHGLIKYNGHDDRTRPKRSRVRKSFFKMLR